MEEKLQQQKAKSKSKLRSVRIPLNLAKPKPVLKNISVPFGFYQERFPGKSFFIQDALGRLSPTLHPPGKPHAVKSAICKVGPVDPTKIKSYIIKKNDYKWHYDTIHNKSTVSNLGFRKKALVLPAPSVTRPSAHYLAGPNLQYSAQYEGHRERDRTAVLCSSTDIKKANLSSSPWNVQVSPIDLTSRLPPQPLSNPTPTTTVATQPNLTTNISTSNQLPASEISLNDNAELDADVPKPDLPISDQLPPCDTPVFDAPVTEKRSVLKPIDLFFSKMERDLFKKISTRDAPLANRMILAKIKENERPQSSPRRPEKEPIVAALHLMPVDFEMFIGLTDSDPISAHKMIKDKISHDIHKFRTYVTPPDSDEP